MKHSFVGGRLKEKKHFYLIRCWFVSFYLIDKGFCPVREFVFCNKLDRIRRQFWRQRDYNKIGVHFFEKIKGIVKKGNCANNFWYRLNFSKKKLLKVSYCQENKFFSAQVS